MSRTNEKLKQTPPIPLVKTWFHLLQQGDSAEVSERAQEMLLGAFDSPQCLKRFLTENKIM